MAKVTLDRFLDLVRRSGLVDREVLLPFLSRLKQETLADPITDPRTLGERLVAEKLLTRWQCDQLLEGRHKGFCVKQYKLLDHLGTGGMSSVYLGEHILMHRRVAIKVLPKNRVEDSSYLERFHREAQAVAALDHRNIVRAYDVDNDGAIHFLVMEYIEGQDLQVKVSKEGPIAYAQAAEYIRQAALGLAHAHAAGLIHRDVKPANLLLDTEGVVKVLDLGLARFSDDSRASLTVTYDETVLGTADYLAPEQAVNSHNVDYRADIYSLGCSLYFLLTGHPPFPDGTLPQRLMMHQKHAPARIEIDRPDAPKGLVSICRKMMAKKADSRQQSAREVVEDLARWLVAQGHADAAVMAADFPPKPVEVGARQAGGTPRRGGGSSRIRLGEPLGSSGGSGSVNDSGLVRAKRLKDVTSPTSDTIANRGEDTSKTQGESPLPQATPIPDLEPLVDDDPLPNLLDLDDFPELDSDPLARPIRKTPASKKNDSIFAEIPIWSWALIAVAGLLAIVVIATALIALLG